MSTTKPHGMYRHHCPTCGEFFQARNFNRHRMACLRRKRNHDRKPDTEAPDRNVSTCLAVVSRQNDAAFDDMSGMSRAMYATSSAKFARNQIHDP